MEYQEKKCYRCQKIKPFSEFYKNKAKKDGLTSACKRCSNEIGREGYLNNREKRLEYVKQYQLDNRKKCLKYLKQYQLDNKESINKRQREYYKNNHEKALDSAKRSRIKYREKKREAAKLYRIENVDIIKERAKQRWAADIEVSRAKQREYYAKDPEYQSKRARGYRATNPDKYRKQAKILRLNNIEKYKKNERKYHKKRMQNYTFKLSADISASIRLSLKGNKNGRHWEELVGYTLQELIKCLEAKFQSGMTWGNRGKWHIDHKKPIASFNFNSYEDSEFKECWALDNLQPLWAFENLSKGNKII